MARYPRWRFVLLLAVLFVCGLYAMPNIYPDAPAIQVTSAQAGGLIEGRDMDRLQTALEEAGLEPGIQEQVGDSWLIRLPGSDEQLRARDIAERVLGRNYIVALNLAATTPEWLRSISASPMNLGLDLRGGVHFLLQVDMDTAINQRIEAWAGELRIMLRDEGIRYREVVELEDGMEARFDDSADLQRASRLARQRFDEFAVRTSDDGLRLAFSLLPEAVSEIQNYAVDQNRTALNNRVNELGVAEPVVQRQGADRIVVQLPGIQDAGQARRILGRTATLEFRLVADDVDQRRVQAGIAPPGTEIFPFKDDSRGPVVLRRQSIVTGDQVTNAQMGFDENGIPQVNINLDAGGARRMQRITSQNINRPMGVLFIETRTDIENITDEETGERRQETTTSVEEYVINVANIRDTLGSRFRITGLDSAAEASELALLLRAGGLAAPVYIVEERTIGPSLGADNIRAGINSMLGGLALVLLFMIVRYKVFGVVANVALLGNLVIIVGVMSLIPGATLTLPGIAGIVLTVGMAVDANVLIFERVRQELRLGQPPLQAIQAGYARAFQTILDANLTTLIVAVILFAAGTGSVQGFAVTLFIGILTSMFTSIVGTRAIIDLIYGGRQRAPAALSI